MAGAVVALNLTCPVCGLALQIPADYAGSTAPSTRCRSGVALPPKPAPPPQVKPPPVARPVPVTSDRTVTIVLPSAEEDQPPAQVGWCRCPYCKEPVQFRAE